MAIPVARFTSDAGTGSETLHIAESGDHYAVEWHTDVSELESERTYRLSVLVGPVELGYADLLAVTSGRDLRHVNSDEFIAVKDGNTLPIKFVITADLVPIPPLSGIIVFRSIRGGPSEIYRMKPDGTEQIQLTSRVGCASTCDRMPDLSPSHDRLLFTRDWNVYVGRADGSALQPITFAAPNTLPNIWARWSPDGARIAWESQFACCGVANREMWIMNADGSGKTRLTSNGYWDGGPSWAPDGSTLAFDSDRNGTRQIFTMSADGTNVTQLTTDGLDFQPRFSPDGSRIMFTRQSGGRVDVWVMNRDGSGQRPLTFTGNNREADWSPNGEWIAFRSDRDGDWISTSCRPAGPSCST